MCIIFLMLRSEGITINISILYDSGIKISPTVQHISIPDERSISLIAVKHYLSKLSTITFKDTVKYNK